MQNVLRVILTFALIFSCCTQVRNIKNSQEPESFYSKVTKAANGKTVAIITISDESYEGTDLMVANDSTKWILVSSGERVIFPTNQIHKVRVKDPFKGLVGGFLFGIPAGLGALLIAGALELDLPDPDTGEFTGMVYLIYAITIGALVGGGIGAATGHKDEYIINPLEE
jgi:hypothetical protein